MSYPTIVEASGSAILQNGQGFNAGPFANGTNLYAILQGENVTPHFNAIAAYKSTDAGLTWTLMDAAHEITNFTPGGGYWSVFRDVTKLYVTYFDSNLNLIYFDMATDTWTTGVATNAIGFPNVSGAIQTYQEITYRQSAFTKRSDNSFVIPYVGTEVATGTRARTRFDVWTGAAWTVSDTMCGENGLANDDLVVAVILGANDRTHVFYVEYNTKTLKTRTITSTNSVIAAVTVASDIFDPGGVNTQSLGESIGYPAFNSFTGELAIPYKDVNGHCKIARATSADSPVWSTEQVDSTVVLLQHGQSADGSQVVIAFYWGVPGALSVVFLNNNTAPYTLFRSDKVSGAWTVPAALMTTAPTFNIQTISMSAISTGTVQVLIYSDLNANLPVSYFQGAGSPSPSPSVSTGITLIFDVRNLPPVILPFRYSECRLCDQPCTPQKPNPIMRSKDVYVSTNL